MSKSDTYKLIEADKIYETQHAASALPLDGAFADLRRNGLERFKSLGLPTQKQEEWRFINLAPLAGAHFSLPAGAAVDASDILASAESYGLLGLTPVLFVFVNGHYRADLSNTAELPSTITVKALSEGGSADETTQKYLGKLAVDDQHPFVALSDALFTDGLMVHVPANTVVTTPMQVLYLTTETDAPVITSPRLLLVAEKSSQVTLLESFIGPEDVAYFTNSVSEFDVEENAVVDHYRLNIEGKEAFHIATVDAHQERNSNFSTQTVTFGGRINRNDVGQHLDGPGAFGIMNGLYQISGNQVVDNHTRIDHAQPNCETHELYKGILDNKARGIFNGRIMVRQIAQKTDSKQTNRTLLLSSDAVINTNPQLEIFADDVKCTHGATIGQLDENQLYYLKSRGISEEIARRMLVFAFANDVVEKIKLASLRDLLEHHLLIASQEAGKVLAQAK
jgi:Fe-S cluster assembly protein SufD